MSLSVPYLRILKITKHIADAILKQSKDLNFFLSRDTQNDVLIVIAKDNIDLNPTSNAATMDYHGAGLSLIQMHSKKSESTVYDYIYTMDNSIHSLKIDSLPEEHSQISTFVSDLAGFCARKFNDPEEIPSLDFLYSIKQSGKEMNGWIQWLGIVSSLSEIIQES